MTDLDETDRRLLRALQQDSRATAADLAEILKLSPSQAARRRQRLEATGVVRGYTARLDPERLGLHVQALVQVSMATHNPANARSFVSLIQRTPDIVSAWTLTGEADYLLRVWCRDLAALNRLVHQVILAHDGVARVQSQIVMEQVKRDAPLPA